jgi:arylformamidase
MIDVSQPLGPGTATWPGDRPFELDWTMRRDRGDSVDVAAIALSVHSGTHVDGPRHVVDGPGAGELALEAFMGPALVVDVRDLIAGDPPLVPASALDGVLAADTPRVLFRTRDAIDPAMFPERVVGLSPALARRLADEGFVLVGTDAPSVDPVTSRELEAHRVLAAAGIPNVENLVLSGVQAGRYTFVGFPLPLREADSAPVRAVSIP